MNRAAVSIPEKLFFKIGEVCDITGVQAHVLRYWESEFPMLAPQKNRAGQRTYRKRDVEMVLRIKELLYEDQYTIAGAKKKLVSELRGASKLKVVTPEMSSAPPAVAPAPQSIQPQPQSPSNTTNAAVSLAAPPVARASFDEPTASSSSSSSASSPVSPATIEPKMQLTDERRAAVRRLQQELRELLTLLDAGDAPTGERRK
jgi:DNA-binding transcriptional MerR regulator